MKRASVWKGHALGIWHVDITDGIEPMRCKRFLTYPAALAYALAEVHPTPTGRSRQMTEHTRRANACRPDCREGGGR